MDRLVRFRMAEWRGDDHIGVHPKVPALERHRIDRLPEFVQSSHHRLLDDHLLGLVARAAGREVGRVGPAEAVVAAVNESPIAARLRAFGTERAEPRSVAR